MNTERKLHPSEQLLNGFAQGSLAAGTSVSISAHLEFCKSCRQQVHALEAAAAQTWAHDDSAQTPPAVKATKATTNVADLVASIVSQPQQQAAQTQDYDLTEVHLMDRSVLLPKVLAKAASKGLVWKKLPGGVNQAIVDLDSETHCEFIYMTPGGHAPVHTHKGTEITLILDGSFSDELGTYHVADFIVRDKSHKHRPMSEDGCLCFAVLDGPVSLTSGLGRLANPLLNYNFRRNAAARS